ncbi:hypothetical protein [Sphingomonas sp. 32-62-10]
MRLLLIGLLSVTLAIAPSAFAQDKAGLVRSAPVIGAADSINTVAVDPERMDEFEALQLRAFEKNGSLGVVTVGMNQHEIIVLCHTVAQNFGALAAAETDRDSRIAKFVEVWRFEQRLAEPFEHARKALGESGYSRALIKSGQSMNLLSMMPDPQIEQGLKAGSDMMFVWATRLASRCDQMLDEMGIAKVSGDPPPEYLEAKTRFRFRGADYTEIFADTELGPYAEKMCRGGAAPNFAGAPLDQRGYESMSLLDWAIECEDRAAFDALIAAGIDLDASGLWGDPPLVRTASEKRLWFLTRLLDEGVKPDTMGRSKSALLTSNSDLDATNFGGDTRAAFNLLRERGASLNFPNFQGSIWHRWGLHETRWDLIIEHWDEFESDPVELARDLEFYLSGDMNWARKKYEGAAREVKTLLIKDYAVCFPVGNVFEMKKDGRGFRIQPDCPTGDLSQTQRD